MKIELSKRRNRRFSIYLSLSLILFFVIFNLYIVITDGIHATDFNSPLFIIILILFVIDLFEIFIGKPPYIQEDGKEIFYRQDFFKKTETIAINDLKEIKYRQNSYSFIGKNNKTVEIPLGNLTYQNVQSFKNEINRLIERNDIPYTTN